MLAASSNRAAAYQASRAGTPEAPAHHQAAAISGEAATNTGNAAAIIPADNSNAGEAGTITGDHLTTGRAVTNLVTLDNLL